MSIPLRMQLLTRPSRPYNSQVWVKWLMLSIIFFDKNHILSGIYITEVFCIVLNRKFIVDGLYAHSKNQHYKKEKFVARDVKWGNFTRLNL